MQPADFLAAAESAGLLARLDNHLILRCVQVVRRLQAKNREIGLFCNVSMTTLNDTQVYPQLFQFMEANRAIAPSLMFELSQNTWRSMGPLELEALAALREIGFRFSMGQVTDLRMDPRDLAERGIRFVKIAAPVLLGRATPVGSDIRAADLSDLLARFGISLIADKIEAENQAVDLLDYDVRYGQGLLFSGPRPVDAEALRGAAEQPELALTEPRDRPSDPTPTAARSSAAVAR
jgi:cyclic-di-GMP phosphodiesterase TipF (flagellum assembly factor)